MLKMDLKPGESVKIGDVTITLEDKSGKVARLSIEAPTSVPIDRVSQATPASMAARSGIGS
ncbi:carbon storage regulator [Caballeronia sp. SEWSISQ10-4 2]|jgi:sRNA-binding carbon storage regulator CsrA|uniref:carbon storage regulator n=1 Tax=Caballeronia sp. SEWSISQ10-4 2 TaxID=2937438 RepID=UPI00264BEB6D|nr:carbon storage regulator [Caballeronia sp. SEWSISQ10-4 2]MDN7179099.1 carbon storage regulator [Caballeronia sp. SEWSISQ10-4 2]